MATKISTNPMLARRSVLLAGAAVLAALTPKSGHSLVLTAQGDAPTSSRSGGGSVTQPLGGKVALVTGSTDGLGKAVALKLADLGATVLVHGRNVERGSALVDAIKKNSPGHAMFYRADFASLAEVRKLAEAVQKDHKRIHLLINNAGIGTSDSHGTQKRELSADGHELRFAVNYLSGYLLTRLLIPTLVAGAPSRIVNVASLSQRPIEFDNAMLERDYDAGRAYGQSKLAQIMFTQDLASELAVKNITVNALHPATYMDTTMVRSAGLQPRTSVEEGASAVLYVATSPELKLKSGLFFNGTREMQAHAAAYDVEARRQLRELSERLTRNVSEQ